MVKGSVPSTDYLDMISSKHLSQVIKQDPLPQRGGSRVAVK